MAMQAPAPRKSWRVYVGCSRETCVATGRAEGAVGCEQAILGNALRARQLAVAGYLPSCGAVAGWGRGSQRTQVQGHEGARG